MESYKQLQDFKTTHFDYPELSRIVGEPTLASLITPRNQVKANAQTVDTTLGGGAHGHLGLISTPQVYATITGTSPYIRPALPTLDILPTDTQYQIAQKRHQYGEDMRQYREVQGIERAIIQQLVAAIEPKYIRALRDDKTNKITKTIPNIFRYLFETYGDISPRELQQLRNQVETLVFDPTEPVDSVFSEIEDLDTIASMANNPMTEKQKMDMAYLILQNTKRFSTGLKKWDKKDLEEQDWQSFKDHFRKEQKDLRKCGELTIADTLNKEDFVNLLSEGIKEGVKQALAARENDAVDSRDDVNTNDNEKEELMKQIEQMNATIAKMQQEKTSNQNMQYGMNPMMMSQHGFNQTMMNPFMFPQQSQQYLPNNSTNGYGNNRSNNNNNNNRRNGRRRNPGRRFNFYNRYCWSCGGCDHWGRNCNNKKQGHIDTATFRNKQGGSVDNCFSN